MAGRNLHGSGMNRPDFSIDDAAAQAQIKTTMGADTARIWAAYKAADPKATAAQLLARVSSDQGIRANTGTQIERKASLGGAPAFLYLPMWPAPFMGGRFRRIREDRLSRHARTPLGGLQFELEADHVVRRSKRRQERSRPGSYVAAAARRKGARVILRD
jgi:hypothetical protein